MAPQTPEQRRVCEEFKCLSGWQPESAEPLKGSRDVTGVWSVRVRIGLGPALSFTFAHGLLVGIFPKKRGQAA